MQIITFILYRKIIMNTIYVNGKRKPLVSPITVAGLLTELNMQGKKIAVEKNGIIVPKSRHQTEWLAVGDNIEIVTAVGGG